MLASPWSQISLHGKRIIEAVFQPGNDLVQVEAAMLKRDQRGEFVAAQPRQHIAAQQLAAHARGHCLEVKISHVVAICVVDRLEFVQVDIDQSEDAAGLARLFDLRFR